MNQVSLTEIPEPCKSCGGRCCNRFAVYVTSFDMRRVADWLSVPVKEFVRTQDVKEITHSREPLILLFDEKKRLREYAFVLKRQKNNECVFYRNDKGCSIYPARPAICRTYPFEKGSDGKVEYTKPFACWRKWGEREYDKEWILEAAEKRERELEEYGVAVRKWNAKMAGGGTVEECIDFLLGETSND